MIVWNAYNSFKYDHWSLPSKGRSGRGSPSLSRTCAGTARRWWPPAACRRRCGTSPDSPDSPKILPGVKRTSYRPCRHCVRQGRGSQSNRHLNINICYEIENLHEPAITCCIIQLHVLVRTHWRSPVSLTESALLADVVVVNTPAREVALVGKWIIKVCQVKTSEDLHCFPRVSYLIQTSIQASILGGSV